MKETIKNGILVTRILESMNEDDKDIIMEQTSEIKPSRISRIKHLEKKKEKKRKHKFDDDYE